MTSPSTDRKRLSRERQRRGQRVFSIVIRDEIGLIDLLSRAAYLDPADSENNEVVRMAVELFLNEQVRV